MHFTLRELLHAEKKDGRIGGGRQKGFGMPTLDAVGQVYGYALFIFQQHCRILMVDIMSL